MCRICSAATMCVQQSHGLIAMRTTTFAYSACIADAICRTVAVDDPSPFSLHYSGLCEGPTQAFGIEAGSYETIAANMPIVDPVFTSLRFRCLDYLTGVSLKDDGSNRPTIFNFDQSMTPMGGDLILIDQLSIELALPRPRPPSKAAWIANSTSLISGVNGALLETLPEVAYFRDIVFHFKDSVSGKAAASTELTEGTVWLPHQATLKWSKQPRSVDDPTPEYTVVAYRNTIQDFVQTDTTGTTTGSYSNFLQYFGMGTTERRKLSVADPTNIVMCCSPKAKSKPISIENEDDILHLTTSELPNFGNVLKPSDSGRFLSFLTAPYIRIPLVLDFFANGDPTRLTALRSRSLHMIVDAALFEPGRWRSALSHSGHPLIPGN